MQTFKGAQVVDTMGRTTKRSGELKALKAPRVGSTSFDCQNNESRFSFSTVYTMRNEAALKDGEDGSEKGKIESMSKNRDANVSP